MGKSKPTLADGTIVDSIGWRPDLIDVTPAVVPNPSWSWTCPKGHIVRFMRDPGGTPASQFHLEKVKVHRKTEWSEDGPYEVRWYVCGECPRARKPVDLQGAYLPSQFREYEQLGVHYFVNGEEVSEQRYRDAVAVLENPEVTAIPC